MIVIDCPGEPIRKRGRPRKEGGPVSERQRSKARRAPRAEMKRRCIAVLDFETDPFDNDKETIVKPFCACLYSDQFEQRIFWNEDGDALIAEIVAAIEALPDEYTIYAHSGGKFDFMFILHRLRGAISFKGRGIMSAKIGAHELRDSYDIIPERLAAYRKDEFDYSWMLKVKRNKYRAQIIKYMVSDCVYLFEIVRHFVDSYGLKLTIGQTAMGLLRQHYQVEKFSDGFDSTVRQWFFGGRVECIRGRGDFRGAYKLYDVNSMYPFAMATYEHPIGGFFDYKMRLGPVGDDTIFIDLECDNRGAMISRTEEGETVFNVKRGRFKVTRWEFDVAMKWGLISNVTINYCLDCKKRSNFANFVLPIYEQKQQLKSELDRFKARGMTNSAAYEETKRNYMFTKYLQNTGYGKFAQNPRRFKEHYLTSPDYMPPPDWFRSIVLNGENAPKRGQELSDDEIMSHVPGELCLPEFEHPHYWIWSKPAPSFRFNNVGTAASITGAARAILLDAIQRAREPIYCDTDSLICRELPGVELHPTKLGAWDLEDEFTRVLIAGKKLYACERKGATCENDRYKIRSKGSAAPDWAQMLRVLAGNSVELKNRAPTLDRFGGQKYLSRTIRATAPELFETRKTT